MSDDLSLLEPIKYSSQKSGIGLFLFVLGLFVLTFVLLNSLLPKKEVMANIAVYEKAYATAGLSEKSLVENKNSIAVAVRINNSEYQSVKINDLGVSFSMEEPNSYMNFNPFKKSKAAKSKTPSLQVVINYKIWETYLRTVKSKFEKLSSLPQVGWTDGRGWNMTMGERGVVFEHTDVKKSLEKLIKSLEREKTPAVLDLITSDRDKNFELQQNEISQKYEIIKKLVEKPVILALKNEKITLDLNSEEDFISFNKKTVELNQKKLKKWVNDFVVKHTREAEKVSIVGKEEVRAGVFKAVIEGEFKEGQKINQDELFQQILGSLEKPERLVTVKTYEIPVKVYSALENVDYELLSVGYSEYSKGNDANRVHNVTTGLKKINGTLIEPGKDISFNRSVGTINQDFKTGYGIFGTVALPVLGGGICQVSTTFYRALLNLGVPITMRQNHSWDLSYYQAGGYGLDATIFPAKGLDVKAVNDLPSHLLIYSYTRPETEEAFVLIYGKGDGRKVVLEPEKDYVPFRGAKTLKWKYSVEMPSGEVREHEIISRYRA